MSLQLAWGPINDPLFFFNCSMFGFSLRHIVASNTLEMSLVNFCVRKKKGSTRNVCTFRVRNCFQSVYSVQMSREKCHGCMYLLINRSFSVSATLPFAALDQSLLYLWIYCALINCCSLLPFRFPQQLCFHTESFL